MGGPLALGTVAYGVTGAMLVLQRRKRRAMVLAGAGAGAGAGAAAADSPEDAALCGKEETARLAKDQQWFLAIFVVKVALGLVAFAFKPALGLLFFAAYAVYFWREMRGGPDTNEAGEVDHGDGLAPLKLQPKAESPATWAVVVQTLAALAVIFAASQLFVKQLESVGPMIGLSSAVTALLLAPIATELPEIMNAIIWVRQGKTQLALANISGAMMIQATVPSGLGLLFTSWHFSNALLWSGVVTMVAIVYLLATMRAGKLSPARLGVAAGFYLVFAVGLVPLIS
jgi:cation:H+ antiporter